MNCYKKQDDLFKFDIYEKLPNRKFIELNDEIVIYGHDSENTKLLIIFQKHSVKSHQ